MRNLKLLYQRTLKYDGIKAKLMVQHPLEDVTFIYFDGIVKSINHKENEVKDLCEIDGVIAMEFIQINECLCFATESGEIIQYNFMTEDHEAVGLINDGIEAMCWSPDQELVVFVTK
jgi:elongator complex protein 1